MALKTNGCTVFTHQVTVKATKEYEPLDSKIIEKVSFTHDVIQTYFKDKHVSKYNTLCYLLKGRSSLT